MTRNDPRRSIIWSVNAWVGMATDLSPDIRNTIFWAALKDRLPDATEAEVGYALGMISPD